MKTKSKATEFDQGIGRRIRLLREAHGMSQAKLGDLIGTSFQQVQKYELGKNKVPLWAIERMAEVLGVSPSQLAGWEDLPAAPENKLEARLVSKFRKLTDKQQECFIALMGALSKDEV